MSILLIREKIKHDRGALVGAFVMLLFAVLAGYRWSRTGYLFFVLLVFRDLLWLFFFLIRKSARRIGSNAQAALAYFSSALPLCYLSETVALSVWRPLSANVLGVVGFLIATLATIELGSRVGVAPAARGEIVRTGVYRLFRHPMYAGYIIAEFGWVFIRPENIGIFLLSVACYIARTRFEDRVLR